MPKAFNHMLNPKEKSILQYLYQHRDRYVTSKELATHLSCSDRTVRTQIRSLLDYLSELPDLELNSKQGFGYQLQVFDEATYLNFAADHRLALSRDIIDMTDRRNYILNKLIFEQEKLFFDDLMDQLYVSRSTLSADLKKIRQALVPYQLSIESKANQGVYVTGSEQNKRRFIMDYFFSGHFLQNIHQYIGDDFFRLPLSFEELTIIVLDECRSQEFKLSDFVLQNLIVHLALAIKRVGDGFKISELTVDRQQYQREIKAASNILKRLQQVILMDFPDEEISYIALHLISEKRRLGAAEEAEHISLRQDLMQASQSVDEHYGCGLNKDFTFIEGLLNHLEVLLERVRHNIHLDNPLLDDIKSQYKEAFVMAGSLMMRLEHFKDCRLSDDELAYISLHILASMERRSQAKKLNALVICATGYGSAQMLRMRLENELGHQVHVVDLVGYYEISDDKLEGIDFIISTVDLSALVFSVPVFTVSVFLKEEEVRRIKDCLPQLADQQQHRPKAELVPSRLAESFDAYFSDSYFKIYSTARKDEVLDDLVCLFYGKRTDQVPSMLELIRQREQMSTVVFDDRIAVPHPIKALDKYCRVGVGIIQEGLYWNQDFPKIQLVFLVAPSAGSNEGLSDLTQRIVELTDLPEVEKQLASCQSFAEFRQIFLENR